MFRQRDQRGNVKNGKGNERASHKKVREKVVKMVMKGVFIAGDEGAYDEVDEVNIRALDKERNHM
jgi:hypothetical protein